MDLIDNLNGVGRRSLLCAHLHQLAILLLRPHQHLSLSRIVAARLFQIDVLARLQCGDGHRCVPMVRGSNCDGVHILLLQNPAKVFVRRSGFLHLLLHCVGELSKDIAVHIADMRNAGSAPVCLEC